MTDRQKTTFRIAGGVGTVLLAAVVGLGIFVAFGAAGAPSESPVRERAIPVSTLTLEPVESFTARRAFTGILVAGRTSELSFERGGELVAVHFDQGRRVAVGEELARLDTRQLLARRDELRAKRRQAAALLAELVAGPRQEQIAAAKAEVRNLEAQVQWQQRRHERRKDLRSRSVIAQEEFDESRYGLDSAVAQLDVAQKRLDELLAGTRVEQKDAQAAAVAQLDAELAQVEVDLEDSRLVAPFAGVIARRHLDEGAVVAAGTPVLRLVEDKHLEAHVGLPPDAAARLSPGAAQDVIVDGPSYPAAVVAVLPELDVATRTRTVVFELAREAAGTLVPGQVARVEIAQQEATAGYWLPTAALDRGARGLWSVLAVVGDEDDGGTLRAERRDVEVLHTEADRVLVRGTLAPGDCIVAEGVHRLVEGQRVEIRN